MPEKMNYIHTIDLCVLRFDPEQCDLQVLMALREKDPYVDCYALPGMVVNGDVEDTTIEQALDRLVASPKVGIELVHIEQVCTVGGKFRDPRCWSSSTVYLGLARPNIKIKDNQAWMSIKPILNGSAGLPFDHADLVRHVEKRFASKASYTNMPLLLLDELFSLQDAQAVYGEILDRPILKSGMSKRLLKLTEDGFIGETDLKRASVMGKSQSLMRQVVTDELYHFDRRIKE